MVKTVAGKQATAKKYYEAHKDKINAKLKEKRDARIALVVEKKQIIFNLHVLQEYLQATPVSDATKGYNHKNIEIVFRALLQDHECLFQYIMKHSISSIIAKLRLLKKERDSTEGYSLSSHLKHVELLLNVSRFIKGKLTDIPLNHLFDNKCKQLVRICTETKQTIEKNTIEKNETKNYIKFEEMSERVVEKFGVNSKQNIIVILYRACHARDNFYLTIVDNLEKCFENMDINYLIVDNSPYITIGLYAHKTDKNYDSKLKTMSEADSIIVRKYVADNKLTDLLFPEFSKTKKLSICIKKMLQDIGVDDATGSNTMRKIIVNSFPKDASMATQLKNAESCYHSRRTEKISYVCGPAKKAKSNN